MVLVFALGLLSLIGIFCICLAGAGCSPSFFILELKRTVTRLVVVIWQRETTEYENPFSAASCRPQAHLLQFVKFKATSKEPLQVYDYFLVTFPYHHNGLFAFPSSFWFRSVILYVNTYFVRWRFFLMGFNV